MKRMSATEFLYRTYYAITLKEFIKVLDEVNAIPPENLPDNYFEFQDTLVSKSVRESMKKQVVTQDELNDVALQSKCPRCKEMCYTMDNRVDECTIECPNCGEDFIDKRLL